MSRPTPPVPPAAPGHTAAPEEVAIAFEGPAVLTNKFYLTISGAMARIAFTEQAPQPDGSVSFRTAVTMTVQDLFVLRDLIHQVSNQVQIISVSTPPPPPAAAAAPATRPTTIPTSA